MLDAVRLSYADIAVELGGGFQKIWPKVKPEEHAAEVLAAI